MTDYCAIEFFHKHYWAKYLLVRTTTTIADKRLSRNSNDEVY